MMSFIYNKIWMKVASVVEDRILMVIGFGLLTMVACSDANLYRGQLNANAVANVNVCTTPAQSIVTNLKYIFVFDHSGSNQQNYIPDGNSPFVLGQNYSGNFAADPLGGTDPTGAKRFQPLIQFINGVTDGPNVFYSSINFGTTANVFFPWYNGAGVKTSQASAIGSVSSTPDSTGTPLVSGYSAPQDGGDTNYQDTLNTIQTMIDNDIAKAQLSVQSGQPLVASDYIVFWVSDGAPYMNGGTVLQPEVGLKNQIQAILALRTANPEYVDSITFSTGFYHIDHTGAAPQGATATEWSYARLMDQESAQYMADMAATGQGSFIDFATNTIDYSRFAVPNRSEKYVLRDFWVQNTSAVWWNGQLMLDTDHDGIPDSIELQMGSNPYKYDSDGNGVGDGVEYSLYGTPCGSGTCAPAQARVNAVLCGALPNSGSYADSDGDGLNDCEEKLLGSNAFDFDSNQDWVPDQFEWLSKVAYLSGTNTLLSNPQSDGVSNYNKMKQGLPVNFPISSLHGVKPMSYQLTQVSDDINQTCYTASVQNLATMSSNDSVKVYFLESRGVAGASRRMRTAQTTVSNGKLILNDGDFSQ